MKTICHCPHSHSFHAPAEPVGGGRGTHRRTRIADNRRLLVAVCVERFVIVRTATPSTRRQNRSEGDEARIGVPALPAIAGCW